MEQKGEKKMTQRKSLAVKQQERKRMTQRVTGSGGKGTNENTVGHGQANLANLIRRLAQRE